MRIQEATKHTDPDNCFWDSKDRAVNWMKYFSVNLFSFETNEKDSRDLFLLEAVNHTSESINGKLVNVTYSLDVIM